jgi:phosphate transport system permease protein
VTEVARHQTRRTGDVVFSSLAKAAGVTILLALAGVAVFLTLEGAPAITAPNAALEGEPNIVLYVWPLLYGTLLAALLAMIFATPLAIGVALVISHYAPRRLSKSLGYVIDLLAAVPSVVYGLWGIGFLAERIIPLYRWLQEHLGFLPFFAGPATSGRTILTAGIVLAIMALPIITAIMREVFSQTPRLHEEAALALDPDDGLPLLQVGHDLRDHARPRPRAGRDDGGRHGAVRHGRGHAQPHLHHEPVHDRREHRAEVRRGVRAQDQRPDLQRPGALRRDVRGQLPGPRDRRPGREGSTVMDTATTETRAETTRRNLPLVHPTLPTWSPYLAGALAASAAALLGMLLGAGITAIAFLAAVLFVVVWPTWALFVEGPRGAKDKLVTTLVWSAFAAAVIPLATLAWTVVSRGMGVLSVEFFTFSMRNVVGEGGGIYHAIIGTLVITFYATLISVPVGIMAAIYLVEYGGDTRLGRWVTFLVDVMTGIPSIVAGLFAYALFVMVAGPGVRMGFGGSIALSILMIPIVVRSAEEMLKLVPDELREAAYALGVSKWRTIVKVVLPTALAGIITGVMLAVARVAGETAPLLIIAGDTDSVNFNAFSERMSTLPVFIFYSYTQPGVPPEFGQERAWGAALVLIAIVMILNLVARWVGSYFAPKTGR